MSVLPRTLPLLALVSACAQSDAAPDPPPDLVLVDVTVVDGTGTAALPGRTIEVRDGRITAVRATAAGDVATIDVAGGFVTPGLIDTHVHLASEPEAIRAALDSMLSLGITSAHEMACCAPQYAEAPETYNGGHLWNAFGPPAPYGSVRPDDPAVVAVLEDMRDRGVILDPTLTVMGFVGEEARDWAVEVRRVAHEVGIPISTGTDTGEATFPPHDHEHQPASVRPVPARPEHR